MSHASDRDCLAAGLVRTETEMDECPVCHVLHGEPCAYCGDCGYHRIECQSPENDARYRLVVVETHATGAMPPRIIVVNNDDTRETAEELIEASHEHFTKLGMPHGPLAVHPADDELVAAVAAHARPYVQFRIDADGIARKSPKGSFYVVPDRRGDRAVRNTSDEVVAAR